MEPSVFTKIIRGELPCHKVYEDEMSLAFLDINPSVIGQVLVVPKVQIEFVWDLDDETYQALMQASKKVARRLREVLGTKYVGVKVEGIEVPHAHVKLYPFDDIKDYFAHPGAAKTDQTALSQLAKKLSF